MTAGGYVSAEPRHIYTEVQGGAMWPDLMLEFHHHILQFVPWTPQNLFQGRKPENLLINLF
jgi:hypothetical protein